MQNGDEEIVSKTTLIRAYGEHWSRYAVNWKKGEELRGERRHIKGKKELRDVNAWDQTGIYVLERDFEIVYVGKAEKCLGKRLKDHTADHLAARWDTFSWYGLKPVSHASAEPSLDSEKDGEALLIRTLELVGIVLSNAPLNRSRGKVPGAEKLMQKEYRKHSKSLHEKVNELQEDIKLLRRELTK